MVTSIAALPRSEARPNPQTRDPDGSHDRNAHFFGDQLFNPRKQATAMKTPSKTPVSPCKLDNFLLLAPRKTDNFSRLANPQ